MTAPAHHPVTSPARGTVRRTTPRGPSYIVAEVRGDPEAAARHMRAWKDVAVAVIPASAPTDRQQAGADRVHAAASQAAKRQAGLRASRIVQGVYASLREQAEDAVSPGPNAGPLPAIDHDAFAPDARALALLRGTKIAEADLRASGGAYDLAAVRMLLHGVSRQRIERMVRDGSLLAVPGPSNRRRYPTVQFRADGTIVPGLKAVHAALPTRNPWAVLNFLVQPDDRLDGRSPIDMLKAGAVDDVVAAARSMGQQGA